jgi:23S rRNA (adenine2503-C2)-methyltransferase
MSHVDVQAADTTDEVVEALLLAGYKVIVSIGNVEENQVGSNCGQYLRTHLEAREKIRDGYTYPLTNP